MPSFNWNDYIILASNLQKAAASGPTEACQRSAISRAYYAAFNNMLDYAASSLGYMPHRNRDDHGSLVKHLQNIKEQKSHARMLYDLRLARNSADYDPLPCAWQAKADMALRSANNLLNDLKK